MNRKEIEMIWNSWKQVTEKKSMDPVGQADADIDNDGDVDNSDEYLHNRRKKIKKSVKEGSCGGKKKTMKEAEDEVSEECCDDCGKDPCECENKKVKEDLDTSIVDSIEAIEEAVAKRSFTISGAYRGMWEAADREKHYKGATKPEGHLDKAPQSAKDFVDMHKVEKDESEEQGHKDVAKAGRAVAKQSPARRGDQRTGDKSAQTPKDTTQSGRKDLPME